MAWLRSPFSALVGSVGVEWPTGKNPFFDPLLTHLPLLVRGVVSHTSQGGINPNELAGVLALLLPALIAGGLVQFDARARAFEAVAWVIACALGLALLIATQSRGAMLATALAVCVLLTVLQWRAAGPRRKMYRFGAGFGWIGLLAVALWSVRSLATASQLGSGPAGGIDTLAGRLEIWSQALAMLRDFPITGIGPGQFDPVLHVLYSPRLVADPFVPHAHALYLAFAVELGLPAALAVTWLVVVFFRRCRTTFASEDPATSALGLGLALSMAAFMLFGVTDAIGPGARGGLALWLVLGIGTSLSAGPVSTAAVRTEQPPPRANTALRQPAGRVHPSPDAVQAPHTAA